MTKHDETIQKKLLELEELQETLEKVRKQVISEEEELTNQMNQTMTQAGESRYTWQEESQLHRLFCEQENEFTSIQKERTYFLEEWEETIRREKQQLRRLDEEQQEIYQRSIKQRQEGENGTTTETSRN